MSGICIYRSNLFKSCLFSAANECCCVFVHEKLNRVSSLKVRAYAFTVNVKWRKAAD